jgi:hypothetical protein
MKEDLSFIKLFRKFTDWEWYTDTNVKVVFLHLLLKANYEKKNWRGINIDRGQLFTSVGHIALETALTAKCVRSALEKLKKTGEICIDGASNGTLVTLVKYSDYQKYSKGKGEQMGEQKSNGGQTEGKRRATTKEGEEGEERKEVKGAPAENDFLKFCQEELKDKYLAYEYSLKAKYASWEVNGWKDGNNNEIKNWKSKIRNVIPYLKPEIYPSRVEQSKFEGKITPATHPQYF